VYWSSGRLQYGGQFVRIFCILVLSWKKYHVWTLEKFISFLDPLLGAIAYGAEVTQLGAIGDGAEVCAVVTQPGRRGNNVAPSSAPRSMAPSSDYNHKVCLAQSVERKTLNLKVVGLSPTVG
jgi:hypothetical protein